MGTRSRGTRSMGTLSTRSHAPIVYWMFETAELGQTLDEATYKERLPELRERLLEAQMQVRSQGRFPVILVVGGVASAGKGETVHKLTEWMDPRSIEVHAVGPASDE